MEALSPAERAARLVDETFGGRLEGGETAATTIIRVVEHSRHHGHYAGEPRWAFMEGAEESEGREGR
jgi:hypothetical protein